MARKVEGVSITISDKEFATAEPSRMGVRMGGETPLSGRLDELKVSWLLDHAIARWTRLHGDLGAWRGKMAKWERQSEMDYSDRVGRPERDSDRPAPDVFFYQNDTLGMSEGFADFFTAQAHDDLFGTSPWLAASPVGRDDAELSDLVSRFSQWKLRQTDLEETLRDAIRVAAWGGTAFVKSRWRRETESYERRISAAFSISGDAALMGSTGDFVTEPGELEELDGGDIEWRDQAAEEMALVYDNSCSCLVDYNDIAFDPKAPRLDLAGTDVFHRFRMGLLDVAAAYGISREELAELRHSLTGMDVTARDHRAESAAVPGEAGSELGLENPVVTLVEGFLRCDVLGNGQMTRIHMIFSPDLRVLFLADYLANVTPDGVLPIFPVRIHKIPGRILGMGYFEKYESANDAIDRQHNAVLIRNRKSAHVYTALRREALADPAAASLAMDPDKPFELAPDKRIDDLIEFKVMPDMNGRSVGIKDQIHQMAQMRSGITSAAQGEMKGVPSATTATGTRNIMSRGAILLRDQIVPMTEDIRRVVEYNVHLVLANQDRDETFRWGDGKESVLMEVTAAAVRGLRADVTLTLVQSQSQTKLENAQAAIGIATSYVGLPELEKTAQRQLYIDALSSLGYNNAEDIIREAAADAEGILAMMPPEVAPVVQRALVEAGMMAGGQPAEEEAAEEESAPVVPGAVA